MTTTPVQPNTTEEEDRATYGQRRINLIWERTQATVAIGVSFTTLGVCAFLTVYGRGSEGAFLLLSNVFFLVVGTYFQRTNHTKVGGVTPTGER